MNEDRQPIMKIQDAFQILRANHRFNTREVRSVSAAFFRQVPKDPAIIFQLCEAMLELRVWEMKIVAFDWAYRMRNEYTEATFDVFEHWILNYVSDWWDCDDFCTHAVGALMTRYPQLMPSIFAWCEHENFAVRRCAPVTLILPIKQSLVLTVDPFDVAERLKNDAHYLVLKGYGWMLKVLSSDHPDQVITYLENNHATLPRVAFRYALEKLDASSQQRLMQLKNEH